MTIHSSVREHLEDIEKRDLCYAACLSSKSKGRAKAEPLCDIRPVFQHDRDRIIHSKAFRRLGDKTQVFLSPKGGHYSNRLTHTLEVTQIARTIAKSLFLNESLTEAIALGHDLGHTPFGHAGERALSSILKGGFRHEKQSLRVVDVLSGGGKGLNLTYEVRNGIVTHSKGKGPLINKEDAPATLEGYIVRLSDIVAYLNHDIDDAVRGGFLKKEEVPYSDTLGTKGSARINAMVKDLISESYKAIEANEPMITFSKEMTDKISNIRDFMFNKVYETKSLLCEFEKSEKIIRSLFQFFSDNYDQLGDHYCPFLSNEPTENITDFIASLTDSYAIYLYTKIFIPERLKYPGFRDDE